jgi:hypothetical protein
MKRDRHHATSYHRPMYCTLCGSRHLQLPKFKGPSIEQTTYLGSPTRYIVRADLDLDPLILHPFEIVEIGSFGRKPGLHWRIRRRVCALIPPAPFKNFDEATAYLKCWAEQEILSIVEQPARMSL